MTVMARRVSRSLMAVRIEKNIDFAATPMLADIYRQSSTLAALLERRPSIERFADRNLRPGLRGRAYVFGSGDGWFAGRAALTGTVSSEARSGLDFTLNVAPYLGQDDRILAISMSGNVDRTVEGATLATNRGARLSILTNGEGGRLAALGGSVHSLDIPDIAPFLCGTSSYTATLATLQIAFAILDGGVDFADQLAEILPILTQFIEHADQFARAVADRLGTTCAGVRILGVGPSTATADYGAAKFVEVTRIPAWSDDIEEFAHRQYWGMRTSEAVVLLPTDPASARYANATADALADLGVFTLALEPQNCPVTKASERFSLPGQGDTAGLTQAIGLQLLAYHLGKASGTDPDRREHLKNDTIRFAVSRKLTRRSLLGTGQ